MSWLPKWREAPRHGWSSSRWRWGSAFSRTNYLFIYYDFPRLQEKVTLDSFFFYFYVCCDRSRAMTETYFETRQGEKLINAINLEANSWAMTLITLSFFVTSAMKREKRSPIDDRRSTTMSCRSGFGLIPDTLSIDRCNTYPHVITSLCDDDDDRVTGGGSTTIAIILIDIIIKYVHWSVESLVIPINPLVTHITVDVFS